MAIVVESTSITSGYGTTAVITKPTGLAVGELLVALIEANGNAGTTINTASGWTSVGSQATTYGCVNIQYKVATSGDVAASNFTFTDTAGSRIGGGLLRVSGAPSSSIIADFETDSFSGTATTAVSFTVSLTPITTGSLIVGVIGAEQGTLTGPGTMGSYTATPSITFTELFDQGVELGNNIDTQGAGIYGIYSGSSEITAYTATLSQAKARHIGIMAVITPQSNATGTNALFSISPTFFNQNGTAGATGTNALLQVLPNLPIQSGRATTPTQWQNEPTGTTEWTKESL